MYIYTQRLVVPPLPRDYIHIYIYMYVYTYVVCVCMYMYVYTHMSMYPSPHVDVVGGVWGVGEWGPTGFQGPDGTPLGGRGPIDDRTVHA